MTFSLIRKDFLLAKRFILIIMGLVIALPLYVAMSAPEISSATSFLFVVTFSEMILVQYISMTELKYPKAETLLCSSPYSRSNIVIAKYLLFLLIYAYCFVSHGVMALFFPSRIAFSLDIVLLTLVIISIVYGIYMPLQIKLGAEKTKYAFMVVIFGISFGSQIVSEWVSKIDFSVFANIPSNGLRIGALLLTALVLGSSVWMSVKIYSKKEL